MLYHRQLRQYQRRQQHSLAHRHRHRQTHTHTHIHTHTHTHTHTLSFSLSLSLLRYHHVSYHSHNFLHRGDRQAAVCCITGSSASTNSDSDCQSLHAGVCAHQTSIPTKDANIAREALEILVTCLQLRSELIGQLWSGFVCVCVCVCVFVCVCVYVCLCVCVCMCV